MAKTASVPHRYRPVPRQQRYAQIVELKEKGLTMKQIAEQLGSKEGTIRNVWADPDGAKARALKRSYRGQCADCGGPTDGGNGRDASPSRCIYCVQGRERPAATKPRLCVPIRLDEIPLDVRLEGVRYASYVEKDSFERTAILLAALMPSERTYWVAESARPMVEAWAA